MNERYPADSSVAAHYDAVAATYHEQYDPDALLTAESYPANYFRLQLLLNAFAQRGVRRVIDVGVGEGTPLATMARAGMDVWGFDISHRMVDRSKDRMRELGLDQEHISWGDIQDPLSYADLRREGLFDGLIAIGVMPHVHDDDFVLRNMSALVKPGGTVFIEFRNKLLSLFSFNRYTLEFILDDLLANVDSELKAKVATELEGKLRLDLPPVRDTTPDGQAVGYDAILSKFHNPLEAEGLFRRHGFQQIKLLWYHYHPALPMLEGPAGELFRREAVALEHESSGWRGLFLCSAYVVQAVKTAGDPA
jgi:2-polyprenyl-3-methyl-5-hydroxy-6-metoxy-1,4-benzoquinol methylase